MNFRASKNLTKFLIFTLVSSHATGRVNASQSYFKSPESGDRNFIPRFFTRNLTKLFDNNQTLIDIASQQVDTSDIDTNREFLFDLAASQTLVLAQTGKTFEDEDNSLVTDLSEFNFVKFDYFQKIGIVYYSLIMLKMFY